MASRNQIARAAALTLIGLVTAGGLRPAEAQKVTVRRLSGGILAANSGLLTEITQGTMVHSPDELVTALSNPQTTSPVIIPRDVQWDMSSYSQIPLHSGVSLVGERGALGSRPLLYSTNKTHDYALFDITGNDVRIEGLHLRGPEADDRTDGQKATRAIFVHEDADQQLGRRVMIRDNELEQWTTAGVELAGAHSDAVTPADYNPGWAVLQPADAGLVRVEGNYIHNNVMDGSGYGVVVSGGAYVTVEGNVFNYNRHDVACDGHAHTGYIARFNYVMQGGFKQGSYYNQRFDVHGTADHGYGGAAGEYFLIAFNTIRGDQTYYAGLSTRPALMLRGTPTIGMYFNNNVLVHDDLGSAVSLKYETGVSGFFNNGDHDYHFHASDNQFKTDHSTEIAAGDFDGDGVTDVFLATGTAWFYSRGGSQPWTYLQPSGLLTRDLAFADVDHDGVTDVLWRAPNGTLYYWKDGKGDPIALTSVPVPVSQLRFGDFDGDGKTDIFYTQNGNWNFFYSRTRTWGLPGGSSFPVADLLFADVDGDGKTDVLGVSGNHWSYSSSGTQPWSSLNDELTNSFRNAVIGDFEDTGRNAILFSDGREWYISRGGIGPSRLWRSGGDPDPYGSLKSMLLGHFDGGHRTELVSFEHGLDLGLFGNSITTGNRLVIERGTDHSTNLSELSPQDMR
jgi:hypothetical protein